MVMATRLQAAFRGRMARRAAHRRAHRRDALFALFHRQELGEQFADMVSDGGQWGQVSILLENIFVDALCP